MEKLGCKNNKESKWGRVQGFEECVRILIAAAFGSMKQNGGGGGVAGLEFLVFKYQNSNFLILEFR